ncbi:MAG: DUF3488 domain-containing protein [Thermoleophilia bacterium]
MRADRISLALVYSLAAIGVAPAVLNVSPVYAVLLLAFVVVGLYWDLSDRFPLSSWMLNLLVIVGLLGTLALPNQNGLVGRLLAGSILLLGGKLVAPKAARDMLQVMLLSLLLLIGSAILSASVAFLPLFIIYLLLCTITLLWIPFGTVMERRTVSGPFAKRVGSIAVLLVVGCIPLLLLFFVALPRTPAPLWRGVGPTGAQVTGFSDRVSLGDVAPIARNSSVAFRAELPGRRGPLPQAPYWRGLVLEATDGYSWTARARAPQETGGGGPHGGRWAPLRWWPSASISNLTGRQLCSGWTASRRWTPSCPDRPNSTRACFAARARYVEGSPTTWCRTRRPTWRWNRIP